MRDGAHIRCRLQCDRWIRLPAAGAQPSRAIHNRHRLAHLGRWACRGLPRGGFETAFSL